MHTAHAFSICFTFISVIRINYESIYLHCSIYNTLHNFQLLALVRKMVRARNLTERKINLYLFEHKFNLLKILINWYLRCSKLNDWRWRSVWLLRQGCSTPLRCLSAASALPDAKIVEKWFHLFGWMRNLHHIVCTLYSQSYKYVMRFMITF